MRWRWSPFPLAARRTEGAGRFHVKPLRTNAATSRERRRRKLTDGLPGVRYTVPGSSAPLSSCHAAPLLCRTEPPGAARGLPASGTETPPAAVRWPLSDSNAEPKPSCSAAELCACHKQVYGGFSSMTNVLLPAREGIPVAGFPARQVRHTHFTRADVGSSLCNEAWPVTLGSLPARPVLPPPPRAWWRRLPSLGWSARSRRGG